MGRPRKNQVPRSLLDPIIAEFIERISSLVERKTLLRVSEATRDAMEGLGGRPARKRAIKLCYYPSCKHVASPRHGMFCRKLHADLSKTEKAKIREKRAAS